MFEIRGGRRDGFADKEYTEAMTTKQPTYRLRKFSRRGDLPENYRGTFELLDDQTRQVMASCDVSGHATFSPVSIIDSEHQAWTMKPNRKIMPTRWILTDPGRSVAMQFDQNLSSKLKKYRTILTLLDSRDKEFYRIVDPRKSTINRILGVGPDDWAIMDGDKLAAKVTFLTEAKAPPSGLWQKITDFLTSSDKGIVSIGLNHIMPPPTALAMMLILKEVTAYESCDKT